MIAALLVLAFIEWGCYGPFLFKLGFYSDDWTLLEWATRAGGFGPAVRAYAKTGEFWSRPVELLHFPLLFAVGGVHPAVHHAILLCLETVGAWLFFLLLERLTGSRPLALLAAGLALLYPTHPATTHWLANSPQLVAIILALGSLLLHLRWIETRDRRLLALAMLCYCVSLLEYESCAFLSLLTAGALLADGTDWRRVFRWFWPYAAAFVAVQAWQWRGVPLLLGAANPKRVHLSLLHAALSYRTATAGMTYKTLRLAARSAPRVAASAGRGYWPFWWLFTSMTAWMLLPEAHDTGASRGRALRRAAGATAGGAFGAVLPYALSGTYMPNIYGTDSRTSAVLSLAAALALSSAVAAAAWSPKLSLRRCGLTACVLFVGAFAWTDAQIAGAWARSWTLQRAVLKLAAREAAALPRGATLLLAGVPSHLNDRVSEAVVFDAAYDITSALRLTSGRDDLKANVVNRLEFGPSGYAETQGGEVVNRSTYDEAFLLRYGRSPVKRLSGPPMETLAEARWP